MPTEEKELEQVYRDVVSAREYEEGGEFRKALELYRNSARTLFEAARSASGKVREARVKNAEALVRRYEGLTRKVEMEQAASEKMTESRSRAAQIVKKLNLDIFLTSEVTFDDIVGLETVKEQVKTKILYPMKHPDVARSFGLGAGGGILLFGPPGNGKTHIVRAIANEVKATFIVVNPSQLVSQWFGVFEQNIHDLFEAARSLSPTIIFFDEIDALAPKRSSSNSSVMRRAVPQILAEMDGFSAKGNSSLLIIAATNVPWNLDEALLRPGRFDEKIFIPPPDQPSRARLFEIGISKVRHEAGIDFGMLSSLTQGYSAADISYICRKAAEIAFRDAVETGNIRELSAEDLLASLKVTKPSINGEMIMKYQEYDRSR